MEKLMKSTNARQRQALEIEPIHATVEPVRAYAKQIAELKGVAFSVVTIPEGSAAYCMGYRYVSIPNEELDHYLSQGATLVPDNSIDIQTTNTIESVREDSKNHSRISGDRRAVIVLTEWKPGHNQYGVQFWTEAMVAKGFQTNPDANHSLSTFIEYF